MSSKTYNVTLTVVSAASLIGRNPDGLSNPYVKVTLGSQSGTTPPKLRVLSADFDHTFQFVRCSLPATLQIRVMSSGSGELLLGTTSLSLLSAVEKTEKVLPLHHGGDAGLAEAALFGCGTVTITYEISETPSAPAAAAAVPPPATVTPPTFSLPTPSTPAPVTAMPAPVTAMPVPVTAMPVPVAAMPVPVTAMPAPVTAMPAPVTAMPAPVAAMPVPVTAMPAPVTAMPAPVTAMPVPVTAMPAPVTAMPPPMSAVPAPITVATPLAPIPATVPSPFSAAQPPSPPGLLTLPESSLPAVADGSDGPSRHSSLSALPGVSVTHPAATPPSPSSLAPASAAAAAASPSGSRGSSPSSSTVATRRSEQKKLRPLRSHSKGAYQAHPARARSASGRRDADAPCRSPSKVRATKPSVSAATPTVLSTASSVYSDAFYLFRAATTGLDLSIMREIRRLDPRLDNGFLQCRDYSGRTLLHAAAWHGRIDVLEVLLQPTPAAVLIDLRSLRTWECGDNLLHTTARGGHHSVLQWLRQTLPTVTALLLQEKNARGWTPAECAKESGFVDFSEMLIPTT